MNEFFRFPHTPHLVWLGPAAPRDDKVMTMEEARELLSGPVVIEEKVDGANLGISLSSDGSLDLQNRGHFLELPHRGQFARLRNWLEAHEDQLFEALEPNLIAFGEWCAARHSIEYDRLPDWWILFDIYDRESQSFWCCSRRNDWAKNAGVECAVSVFVGSSSISDIKRRLEDCSSSYRDGPPEGFIIRREDADTLINRAKLVRREFTQSIERHWSKSKMHSNAVVPRLI